MTVNMVLSGTVTFDEPNTNEREQKILLVRVKFIACEV